ncbi:hypothetical protein [Arcobacter porcinus]|uniref:Uncharacterized protein n=1 Tax=Arcobacter porcinus TaxID=1935204 RepID=A0A5C2HCY5_9BACT|nr:hypothetical protein [Arcobacter porcinus]OCL90658.1 hypothetical protein AAX27_01467 [Aliarcobacter thereius]QEP40816.1 hypothetical protein APORC_1218 [Arcobacter porcinus]
MKKIIILILLIMNFLISKDFEDKKELICDLISYKAIKSTIMTEDFMYYFLLANEKRYKTNKDIEIYLQKKFDEMIEKRALKMSEKYGKLEKVLSVSWEEFIVNFYKFHISELAMAGEDAYKNIYYFYSILSNKVKNISLEQREENTIFFVKDFKLFDLDKIWNFMSSEDEDISKLFKLIALGNIEGASEYMNSILVSSDEESFFYNLRSRCNK